MIKIGTSDWNWFYLVVTGWVYVAISALTPATLWLRIDHVSVHDTVVGTSPEVDLGREIVRPFKGEWVVTVQRLGGRGFYTDCVATGSRDFRPDDAMPDRVTLDWLSWPVRCELGPGVYRMKVLWTIDAPLLPQKKTRATSNVFIVGYPRGSTD